MHANSPEKAIRIAIEYILQVEGKRITAELAPLSKEIEEGARDTTL